MHQDIPKVELHCHLDGIVHSSLLKRLEHDGLQLAVSADALAALYPVENYEDFVRWFQSVKPLQISTPF